MNAYQNFWRFLVLIDTQLVCSAHLRCDTQQWTTMYHCTYRNICQLWLCVATGGRTIYGYIHGSSYQTKSCLINLTIVWWLPDNCPTTAQWLLTTSEGLPNDWPMTGPDCLTTTKRLPENCLTTAQQLPYNCQASACLTTAPWLPEDCLWLLDDCPGTTWRLSNDWPTIVRRVSDDCLMTTWRLPKDCLTAGRQILANTCYDNEFKLLLK